MALSPRHQVERVIGLNRGTGGVSYLRKMLDVVLFPKIWKVMTALSMI